VLQVLRIKSRCPLRFRTSFCSGRGEIRRPTQEQLISLSFLSLISGLNPPHVETLGRISSTAFLTRKPQSPRFFFSTASVVSALSQCEGSRGISNSRFPASLASQAQARLSLLKLDGPFSRGQSGVFLRLELNFHHLCFSGWDCRSPGLI
jgi:hypothetical protein